MFNPLGIISEAVGGLADLEIADENRRYARDAEDRAAALQREFAQHGIQWRVADAKAAGIHPVFSMSGGGAAYAPSPVTINAPSVGDRFSRIGQHFSRAVEAQETPEQKTSRHLSEREALSRIRRNEAEAAMFDRQRIVSGPGMPSGVESGPLASQASSIVNSGINQTRLEPSKATSPRVGDESLAAADDVFWKEFVVGKNGSKWLLPNADSSSEAAEALGESFMLTWATIRKNLAENPYFLSENSWLLPFADDIREGKISSALVDAVAGSVHGAIDWLGKYRFRPATTERSGRDRGVNWRARPRR